MCCSSKSKSEKESRERKETRKMNRRSKEEEERVKNNKISSDEVEELLQAAQDQLLLNLSVNSHIASASNSSNNYLDTGLDRRFQALKSSKSSVQTQIPSVDQELKDALGDDLSARFPTLKAKNSLSTSSSAANKFAMGGGPTLYSIVQEEEDEVDQVEKLIQWAKDAARLDPSPPSDDDNDEEDSDSEGRDTKSVEKRK